VKTTVLLIDEAQLERKINEWTLTHAGYEVVTARDGDQALRLAENKAPDVILLDALLPDIKGHLFLAELKRNSATAGVPVIILSSAPAENVERFKREGAAEILEKQKALADGKLLLDTVEEVLHPVL
jgi:DNA-binding response OmpR family regulator